MRLSKACMAAPEIAGASHKLRGYLDSLTSAGYFEGWALDEARPLLALPVSVVKDGEVIASGLAHRFRKDLMESYCGTGWCAFRLRLQVPMDDGLFRTPLSLINQETGHLIHLNGSIASVPDAEAQPDTVDQVCAYDPTVLLGVWQLRACEKQIMAYIRQNGVDQYVRMAYVYVLGRPADDGGLAQYGRSIRQSSLTPVGILEALSDSDEYRSQPRQLIAPNAVGFPFAV